MWYEIFFDQHNNFQWASIAAITSFLAFVSTSMSLVITSIQGKRNRRSTTLVSLHIEELKDLREEATSLISLIDNFLHKTNKKEILKTDPITNEVDVHLNKLISKLYRQTSHSSELLTVIVACRVLLLSIKNVESLIDIKMKIEFAIEEYSRIEYQEIEKYL